MPKWLQMGPNIHQKITKKWLKTWSQTLLKKSSKTVWKLMPPDLAGRGFGCRVSSSRKIPAWSKTCQKTYQKNIQNWTKIHQKVGLEADLFSTWNLHPKISKKVGPRVPKRRPKSNHNASQGALQNTLGNNLGPRSLQGTKSIQNMTSRHPEMVNCWSIFRWKTLGEKRRNATGKHRRGTSAP